MNIDFETLYKMVENLNQSTKEKCLICHFPVEDDELVLTCNHYYHSKCLNKKTNTIKCPYCEKTVKNKNEKVINNGCKIILKSGPRKNQQCGRINCTFHKINNNNDIIIICNAILKSGPRKNEQCKKENCKIHNKKLII